MVPLGGSEQSALYLKIVKFNALILAGLAFLQGAIAGYGFSQVGSRPTYGIILTIAPCIVGLYCGWLYRRTGGLFDHAGCGPVRR